MPTTRQPSCGSLRGQNRGILSHSDFCSILCPRHIATLQQKRGQSRQQQSQANHQRRPQVVSCRAGSSSRCFLTSPKPLLYSWPTRHKWPCTQTGWRALGSERLVRRQRPLQPARALANELLPLGLDFLTFLAATVLVIPIFKSVNASPVLGFLFSGLILEKLGLFRNIEQVQKLSELGVLFLLFEMGLELSLDRLKGLAKYAFGLGTAQVGLTTLAFTLFALPVGNGLGTQILVKVFHANPQIAAIRTLDEAIVIGAALSLSSSAFVLQLLSERGELTTKFGSATLGILLLQDIAVVPFLILLPIIETTDLEGQSTATLLTLFVPTALQTLGSLALLLLGGRLILRRVFELVAESRSDETFVALCLLTVTGASLLTQRLGFSDTLGAFIAGVLLAETNYRTQVEADIRPFRGMLLGLFFVTTGSSLDLNLFFQQWPIVIALTGGLIATKIGIIGSVAQLFGLTKAEAIRTGFMLSQGGEFAFVLLSLANELKILPTELNRLLIIVVVLSMALTPALAEAGKRYAEASEGDEASGFLAQAHLIAARLSCGIPIASTQPLHVPRPYSNPGRR